jgi:integrase
MVAHFGRNVDPTQLEPSDFSAFRTSMAARYAPSRLTKTVVVCKSMFRWAHDMEKIEALPRFGKGFKRASEGSMRQAKAASGSKAFKADEALRLIDAAPPTLAVMIWLGLNAGFGNADISRLSLSSVDLKSRRIDFPRPKTGVVRRCILWPETIAALNGVIKNRPKPKDKRLEDRVFLTATGAEWVVVSDNDGTAGRRVDKITLRFRELMKANEPYREGRSFYGLRHTLESVGSGAKDEPALDEIMGHVDSSIQAGYRHGGVGDDRLRAVTDHVRAWLLLRVAKAGSHRAIMGHPNSYWTGETWSTDNKAAVKFASEEEARSQITEQRVALLVAPFC